MNILVVVPTFNESENIPIALRRIRRAVPAATVLVVDDGSPDGTADIAEQCGKELGDIEVMRRFEKSGLGSAYRDGFHWGLAHGFDACVEMDADLSHEPESLPTLVAPLHEGFELIIGSRYISGGSIPSWKRSRRMLSRGGNWYASAMLGLGVTDSTSGFRVYAASLLNRIDLDEVRAEGYGFQIEMTYRSVLEKADIVEVPIRFMDRIGGESKMSTAIVVEALGLVTRWGIERALGIAAPEPVAAQV